MARSPQQGAGPLLSSCSPWCAGRSRDRPVGPHETAGGSTLSRPPPPKMKSGECGGRIEGTRIGSRGGAGGLRPSRRPRGGRGVARVGSGAGSRDSRRPHAPHHPARHERPRADRPDGWPPNGHGPPESPALPGGAHEGRRTAGGWPRGQGAPWERLAGFEVRRSAPGWPVSWRDLEAWRRMDAWTGGRRAGWTSREGLARTAGGRPLGTACDRGRRGPSPGALGRRTTSPVWSL